MPDLDAESLARDLVKTTANLKRHIETEGQKVGAALGKTYAKAAKEQVDAAEADAQRWKDLNAELRRQMAPLERAAGKGHRIATAVRSAHYRGEKTIDVQTLLNIINAPATPDEKEN